MSNSRLEQMPVRRSCLSVPGASERKLAKAATSGADEVILDLEDAVAVADKEGARTLVADALARPEAWAEVTVAVRVNAVGSPWCHLDLQAVAGTETLSTVVVPKVESAGDLAFVDRLLDGVEAARGSDRTIGVQALIETAAGLTRLDEIAAASPRLEAVILGYADLAASLMRSAAGAATPELWLATQDRVLATARSHGIQAIDGPHLGVAADAALEAAAVRASDLGFDGKWAIHPGQLAALNRAFTPGADEVEQARKVIAALADGAGVARLDGQMVDEPVRVAALGVLARATAAQR